MALTDDDLTRKKTREAFWLRILVLAASLVVVVGLVAPIVITVQIRHQQVQSAGTLRSADSAAKSARETAQAIHACVTPGYSCYRRAQRATSGAVSSINRVIILAAACSANLPPDMTVGQRRDQIQQCVIGQLAVGRH